ncbi:MAG: hypothetical protein HQM03_06955 [Magnetococcales bacterium]|nr:hypothetical protein [Magnetococcales bacterium]
MNVLISLISLAGRYLYILVAIGVLGAMPYSAHLAWTAYQDHIAAQRRLAVARELRATEDQLAERIKDYRKYAEEAQGFWKAIRDNRIEEQAWTTYEVDIKNRLSTVTDLRTMLSHAGPSSRYYFKPKRLEITSLFARELLPQDLNKALYSKEPGFKQGGMVKFLGVEEAPPTPGEKVLFSLSGTYLVFPRN